MPSLRRLHFLLNDKELKRLYPPVTETNVDGVRCVVIPRLAIVEAVATFTQVTGLEELCLLITDTYSERFYYAHAVGVTAARRFPWLRLSLGIYESYELFS